MSEISVTRSSRPVEHNIHLCFQLNVSNIFLQLTPADGTVTDEHRCQLQ